MGVRVTAPPRAKGSPQNRAMRAEQETSQTHRLTAACLPSRLRAPPPTLPRELRPCALPRFRYERRNSFSHPSPLRVACMLRWSPRALPLGRRVARERRRATGRGRQRAGVKRAGLVRCPFDRAPSRLRAQSVLQTCVSAPRGGTGSSFHRPSSRRDLATHILADEPFNSLAILAQGASPLTDYGPPPSRQKCRPIGSVALACRRDRTAALRLRRCCSGGVARGHEAGSALRPTHLRAVRRRVHVLLPVPCNDGQVQHAFAIAVSACWEWRPQDEPGWSAFFVRVLRSGGLLRQRIPPR